jgi:hypothetical protein
VPLRDLEGSTGSLQDLVQFVLQRIELLFHFLKGCELRRDEQAPMLARTYRRRATLMDAGLSGVPG